MKDLFSEYASEYARYRPHYPAELFDILLSHVPSRQKAWDVGTGNGQVARMLAGFFDEVIASDISAQQLKEAVPVPNVKYVQAGELLFDLPDNSVDIITIGQALHWLDLEVFYKEAKRVAKANAWIAAWGYNLFYIGEKAQASIHHLYFEVLGPYWEPERKHIETEYQQLAFPFEKIEVPKINIEYEWTLSEIKGYLNTWHAVKKYEEKCGLNPIDDFINHLANLMPQKTYSVRFPIFLNLAPIN
jgi:ubiquinone/menaquinone biosynthesis C-methylase UbiE